MICINRHRVVPTEPRCFVSKLRKSIVHKTRTVNAEIIYRFNRKRSVLTLIIRIPVALVSIGVLAALAVIAPLIDEPNIEKAQSPAISPALSFFNILFFIIYHSPFAFYNVCSNSVSSGSINSGLVSLTATSPMPGRSTMI